MAAKCKQKAPIALVLHSINSCQSLLVESSFVADTRIRNMPENVDLVVLDGSGVLQTDVSLEELPYHLSDPDALIWCDVASTEGGKAGLTGGSCGRSLVSTS